MTSSFLRRFLGWSSGLFLGLRNYFFLLSVLLGFLFPGNSWALIDGLVAGAKAAKDEAHQRIVENQLIQLAITMKKNYDASIKIYREAQKLNEGKGIINNLASDLSKKAKDLAKEEKGAIEGEFAYYNDSELDRYLTELDEKAKNITETGGRKSLGFMEGMNKESAILAQQIRAQTQAIALRGQRGEAARREGARLSKEAKTATDQALGLNLQVVADQADAANQLVSLMASMAAKQKSQEISQRQAIMEMAQFISSKEGAMSQIKHTGRLTDPVRIPALYGRSRARMSDLVFSLLAAFIAGGLIWGFLQTQEFGLAQVIGVPLAFVFLGIISYEKIFSQFTLALRAVEETVSPWQELTETFLAPQKHNFEAHQKESGNFWGKIKAGAKDMTQGVAALAVTGYGLVAAAASLAVLEAFFWARYALLSLCYVIGPLMIAFCLIPPLRNLCWGWLMACFELALNGIGMRIFMAVVASSGMQTLFDATQASSAGAALTAVIINIVFLMVAITMPFFIHSMVQGSLASPSLFLPAYHTARTVKSAGLSLLGNASRTRAHVAGLLKNRGAA